MFVVMDSHNVEEVPRLMSVSWSALYCHNASLVYVRNHPSVKN